MKMMFDTFENWKESTLNRQCPFFVGNIYIYILLLLLLYKILQIIIWTPCITYLKFHSHFIPLITKCSWCIFFISRFLHSCQFTQLLHQNRIFFIIISESFCSVKWCHLYFGIIWLRERSWTFKVFRKATGLQNSLFQDYSSWKLL